MKSFVAPFHEKAMDEDEFFDDAADFVPNATANANVASNLAGQCSAHLAWAYSGEGAGMSIEEDDGPEEAFCYMCHTKDDGDNSYRRDIELLMANVASKSAKYICSTVALYYQRRIRDWMPGRPEWGPRAVYRHMFFHRVDPETVYVQTIRQCNAYDEHFSRLSNFTDSMGEPVMPNLAFVKHHLFVMRKREESMGRLLSYRERRLKHGV